MFVEQLGSGLKAYKLGYDRRNKMKIRILNAGKMAVDGRYKNGDIVEVHVDSDGLLTESGVEDGYGIEPYYFLNSWKDKYFEIVDEGTTQKPLKETVKVHKKSDPQYTQEAMLQKHLKQLAVNFIKNNILKNVN